MSSKHTPPQAWFRNPTETEAMHRLEQKERCRDYYPLVYICSPYAGDIERNVINARNYCAFAVRQGAMPLAPHLLFPQFLDDGNPDDRKIGLRFGLILLDRCEEVWVFGDKLSEGMVAEIIRAERRGIPIKRFNTDCKEAVL